MSQFKKCKVVVLPTNEKTLIYKFTETNKLIISNHIDQKNEAIPQHLYILSDDEIKKGDWYLTLDSKKIGQSIGILNGLSPIHKKILASTDTSLFISGNVPDGIINLPQPSKSFIEAYIKAYNEGNPITEVMVEYDNHLPDTDNDFGTPVIKKDNTITIRKIKSSWSREEVTELFYKCNKDLRLLASYRLPKWIADNF